jgi:parvulin-like peptidyl-prolyl isomerase
MSSPRPAIVVVAILALTVTAGSALLWVRARHHSPASEAGAVAFVDGSPITPDDLDLRLEQILPMASYHGHVEPDRLVSLKRAALDALVLDELIYREAVAEGRRAPAEAIDAELEAVKARFDSAEQFTAALDENGTTERAFRERLARTVLVREARAAHARQAITETDIATYYRDDPAKFQRPERVHLLEILLRVEPAQASSAAAAERKARAILARLRRGEAFDEVARASSEDEYRVKDGDMGFVHRGRLDAAFEAAVFAAVPGRFEIARSLNGFEVFKVLERQPATQLSLDEAWPIIAEGLERHRREDGLRAWHARLLATARIDIRDPVLRNARAAELAMESMALGGRSRPGMPARSHQ